jgi:hypothetical protein
MLNRRTITRAVSVSQACCLLRVVRHSIAGLAYFFHRCSFTPITKSHNISDSCPIRKGAASSGFFPFLIEESDPGRLIKS